MIKVEHVLLLLLLRPLPIVAGTSFLFSESLLVIMVGYSEDISFSLTRTAHTEWFRCLRHQMSLILPESIVLSQVIT
jgi:hypothetical protein